MFIPLYERASSTIDRFTDSVSEDELPTDPSSLPEVIQELSPILKAVRELPRPRDKELRRLKKDSKLTLDACIKASKWALKLESKASRFRLSATVFWTSLAVSFFESLSVKLTSITGYASCGGEA